MATVERTPASQDQLNRKSVRVIIVEDSVYDAELVERQFAKAGYEIAALRVTSGPAFAEALATGQWDFIIADYTVPGFGAVPALELLKKSKRDIPFIIVSGVITDEIAFACMRAGAHDYVLKDNIARLVPAIEREMRDAVARRQKREAEQAVRYLSAIVESSDDAIVGKTLDGTITSWNRGAERLYGYTAAEMVGNSISVLIPPEHRNKLIDVLQRLARGEHIEQYETVCRHKDGTLVDVAVRISPILDANGNVIGASNIARDITERKRAEQALRESESRLRSLFENSVDAVFLTIPDGRIVAANPAACAMFGMTEDEICQAGRDSLSDPRDHRHCEAIDLRGRTGRITNMELRYRRKNGETFTGEVNSVIIPGKPSSAFVTIRDISDRKRIEAALRESEEHARRIIDNIVAFVGVMTPDGTLLEANETALRAGGITREEVVGRKFWDTCWWNHDGDVQQQIQEAVKKAACGETVRHDVVARTANDRLIDADFMLAPVRDAAGNITYLIPSGLDITQRKQAEEAVRRSEARLRRFYESGMVGVTYWNMDGAITDANDKFLEIVGYTRADLEEGCVNWEQMTPTEYRDADHFAIRELQATGVDTPYEKEYIRKDGKRVPVVVGAAMLDDAGYDGVAFVLDIAERKRAETALIRSEKLASVGRMAATVAHEINNPLAAAMNAVFLASADPSITDPVQRNLELAEKELERVAHITKQTLGFYRETGEPTAVQLPDVLDGVLDLYGPKLRNKSVSVRRRFRSTSPVQGIEGELRQVISNLVSNSIDAVAGNATLHVRTSGPGFRTRRQQMVRLTIADNGSGISPEHLKHIFEPFFTTKETIGTGLGLWVTKELVRKNAGRIRLRSRVGKGTVCSIWLPADRRKQQREEATTVIPCEEHLVANN